MVILSYSKMLQGDKEKFYSELSKVQDTSQAFKNVWHNEWYDKPYTLPYILEKTSRFSDNNGEFYSVYIDNILAACSGVYKADFDSNIALAGTRTWVNKEFRNKLLLGNVVLPLHKEWAIKNSCKIIALCFNDYNKNIIEIFKRNRLGETNSRIKNRTDKNLFYSELVTLGYPVNIQHTRQWVIYERIDLSYSFDWGTIKTI
jgi:hypothetical protein